MRDEQPGRDQVFSSFQQAFLRLWVFLARRPPKERVEHSVMSASSLSPGSTSWCSTPRRSMMCCASGMDQWRAGCCWRRLVALSYPRTCTAPSTRSFCSSALTSSPASRALPFSSQVCTPLLLCFSPFPCLLSSLLSLVSPTQVSHFLRK